MQGRSAAQDFQLASMFYEQRGPLVFSASLHLVAIVVFAIYALIEPEKKPEELTFELVAASGDPTPTQPTLEELTYESTPLDMPKPEDIKLPDRPKPVEQPKPEPVKPKEVVPELPILPAETKPEPKPKPMTQEEFFAQNPLKPKPARPAPTKTQSVKVDLGNVTKNLGTISIDSRIGDITSSIGTTTADEIQAYLARFREAVRLNLASHPFSGAPLEVTVVCDISANGHVSNVRVSRGSGDAVFDRKAVDAFKRVGIFRASPDGRGFRGISFDLEQQ